MLNESGYWAIANLHSDDCGSHFPKWWPAVTGTECFAYPTADVSCFQHHKYNLETC